MLTTLKTENWANIPPLAFYLTPLQNALTDMRQCLMDMNTAGILRCKYIIEDNTELGEKIIKMVQLDNTA